MKMKKKITAFAAAFAILALFAFVINEVRYRSSEDTTEDAAVTSEESVQRVDAYTYGEVENIVSYLADSEEKEKALDRLIDPLSRSQSINVMYIRDVFEVIDAPAELYARELVGMQEEDIVSKDQFDAIYHSIADSGVVTGLHRQDVFVYDMYTRTDETGDEKVIFDGLDEYLLDIEVPDSYMDCILDVYIKNDNIYKINGYGTSTFTLRNVWISGIEDGNCSFLYRDIEKQYPMHLAETASGSDAEVSENIKPRCIAAVTIDNEGICSITRQETMRDVRVEKVTADGLTIQNKGTIRYADDFCVYNVYDEPFCEDSMYVLSGYKSLTLAVENGEAIGAIVDSEIVCDKIRVILSNDDYTSYDMKRAEISGDSVFKVVYPDESEKWLQAGENVLIDAEEFEAGDRITFEIQEKSGSFQINTLSRSYGIPVYKGKIEIDICEDGVLHIINEVPLEEYLYSVVASEMPSTSRPEALKAMAICARGYAYTRLKDESFEDYNADLDDSSLCQVYNNVRETDESVRAVKDTYGIVPTYKGTVIVPLYFSTSGGTTCTNEEIWGGSAYPYLESNLETRTKDKIDLSDEETFEQFMEDSLGYDIIDKDMPYYRWSVTFTQKAISNAINSMLEERIKMSADNIRVKKDEDRYVSEDIKDIGLVVSIKITERTESGVVSAMEIEGTEATILVTGQTNIRNLITPVEQDIVRQDGSTVTGWTSLPSPYYYVEETDNGFVIHGGGFGHGAGMSQNGANILAGEGYNYKYILRHYFSYIDFSNIYSIDETEDKSEK